MRWTFGLLLGTIISFTWGFVSWEVLGWHRNHTFGFKNEADVREVLIENAASGHGTYMMPHQGETPSILPKEEKASRLSQLQTDRDRGPFVYATIRPGKHSWSMTQAMLWSALRSGFAVILLALFLRQVSLPYPAKVAFCAGVGLFTGFAAEMPDWIWFEKTSPDWLVAMADPFIEWTLVGMVLAAFFGKPLRTA
jgi:hypothetical protein